MKRSGSQYKLFETDAHFDNGLIYRPDFITPEEEELLLIFIEEHPLKHARGGKAGEYEAKRRLRGFGWGYDYEKKKIIPGAPLPVLLQRFARRIEKWLDIPKGRVVEALINEYTPGAALGWHRDNEPFEHVVGISLAGWTKMRFRPIKSIGNAKKVISIELEPRSVYVMRNEVRWDWQHSVATARTLRYSITFRTIPAGMQTPETRR